jgi:ACT domain-containing protein
LNASSRSRELEEIHRRDHEELVEMMTKILHDKNLLKMTLAESTREDARNVVEAIELARSYYHAYLQSHVTPVYVGVEGSRRGRDAGETAPRRL